MSIEYSMRLVIIFFTFLTLISTFLLGGLFFVTHQPWVDFSPLEHYNPGKPSILLDDEGNEWGRFQIDRREPISIQHMPAHVINAFIAAEDHAFFYHNGISWRGILRSLIVNIYNRRVVQGASTITQQLVKLLFTDTLRTFQRKIKEQVLACSVEQHFTKHQILETYLNHVYFGCGIYGVEAASQRLWGKHVQDITIGQAATLAAIVRCPNHYCPLIAPERAYKRRNYVLSSMLKLGFITQEDYTNFKQEPIGQTVPEASSIAPHLRETLRIFLEDLLGRKQLYTEGFVIQTTLNYAAQEAAQRAFKQHVDQIRSKFSPDIDGAFIAIEPKSGAIKALIGGYDFKTSQFNRAYARRQMGSIFKPIIYTVALEQGISFTDTDIDEPFTFVHNNQQWRPRNANSRFIGKITLAHALATSNNIVAIKTLLRVGIDAVIKRAQAFHLTGPLNTYPSLALGCIEGSVLESAAMFNVFVNKGVYVEPHMLVWIKNAWGAKIWKYKPVQEPVASWAITSKIIKVLTNKLDRLKKRAPGEWITSDCCGKTGTTNDARTCWFTGATPDLTTALYMGCDNNQPIGKHSALGATIALPLWLEFSRCIPQHIQHFPYDPSLKMITIDAFTGDLANRSTTSSRELNLLVS